MISQSQELGVRPASGPSPLPRALCRGLAQPHRRQLATQLEIERCGSSEAQQEPLDLISAPSESVRST